MHTHTQPTKQTNTKETTRPNWRKSFGGMKWYHMPSRRADSYDDPIEQKLNFALYRMGALDPDEEERIEKSRVAHGLEQQAHHERPR